MIVIVTNHKVEPEDNCEGECESWHEIAHSRGKSRRTLFNTFKTNHTRHAPVPLSQTN
ncbi:hypothetical protein YC2023_045693 [Brassica napus]